MNIEMKPVGDDKKQKLIEMIKKKYPGAEYPEYWLILSLGENGEPMWNLPSSYFKD